MRNVNALTDDCLKDDKIKSSRSNYSICQCESENQPSASTVSNTTHSIDSTKIKSGTLDIVFKIKLNELNSIHEVQMKCFKDSIKTMEIVNKISDVEHNTSEKHNTKSEKKNPVHLNVINDDQKHKRVTTLLEDNPAPNNITSKKIPGALKWENITKIYSQEVENLKKVHNEDMQKYLNKHKGSDECLYLSKSFSDKLNQMDVIYKSSISKLVHQHEKIVAKMIIDNEKSLQEYHQITNDIFKDKDYKNNILQQTIDQQNSIIASEDNTTKKKCTNNECLDVRRKLKERLAKFEQEKYSHIQKLQSCLSHFDQVIDSYKSKTKIPTH